MMGIVAAYLKENDLFNNLTDHQLELIEPICQEFIVQPGEYIFHESTHETELYLIIHGQVDILIDPNLVSDSTMPVSAPIIIDRFWSGQSFGEMALVDEGIRSGSAVAKEKDTHILRIARRDLLDLCEQHPELGYRIMYNLALDISQKIRNIGLKMRAAILLNHQKPSPGPL
jgi:CRP-like cAMP-binding protein